MSVGAGTAAAAIASAGRPRCPNFVGYWAVSEDTENAYGQRCGRWSCEWCGKFRRQAGKIALGLGVDRALARGERVRFITLTDATGSMDVAELTACWKRLSLRLKTPRKGRKSRGRWVERPRPAYLREYALAIEAHKSGSLHLHALALGEFLPQRWLSRQAQAAGFGKVTWIEEITTGSAGGGGIAQYLTKDGSPQAVHKMTAAAYLTARKHGVGGVAARSNKRTRPLRVSRGWPGGSLTNAERLLIAHLFSDQPTDEGPFEIWHEDDPEIRYERARLVRVGDDRPLIIRAA